MKKKLCALLICVMGLLNIGFAEEWLHIGAIAPSPGQSQGVVYNLLTAQNFNIREIDFIAVNQVVPSEQTVGIIKSIIHYLNQFDNNELALIIDGKKTIFVSDVPEILEAFKSLDASFVISASRCHPSVSAVDHYFVAKPTLCFPDSSSFMGKVGKIKQIMYRLLGHHYYHPDYNFNQLINVDFEQHESDYKLDRHGKLFLDLCGLSPGNGDIIIKNQYPYVQVNLQDAKGFPKVVNVEGCVDSNPTYPDGDVETLSEILQAIFNPV